jgi:hypothetical protein
VTASRFADSLQIESDIFFAGNGQSGVIHRLVPVNAQGNCDPHNDKSRDSSRYAAFVAYLPSTSDMAIYRQLTWRKGRRVVAVPSCLVIGAVRA